MRLSLLTLIIFALPIGVGGLINMLIGNYYLKYATDILLFSPGVVGGILLVARIWDAINDPLVGYMNDRSHSKLGRRKSFLVYSALPIVIFFAFIWLVPNLNQHWRIVWSGGFLLLALTALTMLYVPHYSLAAELSQDVQQRNRIFGIRSLIENIGTFAAVAVIAYLGSSATSNLSKVEVNQKLWLVITIIAALLLLSIYLLTKKVNEPKVHSEEEHRFFKSFANVIKNSSARYILTISFFSQFGATAIMAASLYYADYVLIKEEAGPVIIGLFMLAATLSIPIWIILGKKFKKHNLVLTSLLVLTPGFIMIYFLQSGQTSSLNLIYIFCIVLGLFAGSILFFNPALLADAIDHGKHLQSHEALYFSIFTFMNKCSMGLAGVVIGLMLEFSGFSANISQSTTARSAISMAFTLVPALCFAVAAIVMVIYEKKVLKPLGQ